MAQLVGASGSCSGIGAARSSTTRRPCRQVGRGARFGPDWLALVGDSSDGYPGLPGWGAKPPAAVLAGTATSRRSR